MDKGDILKGSDLVVGMRVQRIVDGNPVQIPMVVYEDGVYYNNPLYAEDEFIVLELKDL